VVPVVVRHSAIGAVGGSVVLRSEAGGGRPGAARTSPSPRSAYYRGPRLASHLGKHPDDVGAHGFFLLVHGAPTKVIDDPHLLGRREIADVDFLASARR
jgi:hypothetical protein